jgi:hypothetical protein
MKHVNKSRSKFATLIEISGSIPRIQQKCGILPSKDYHAFQKNW